MKKKRNTFAAQLRNCRTVTERWRLANFGSPQDVVGIVTRAVMQKGAELDTRISRKLVSKWRAELETEIGKLILSLVMAGNIGALRALVTEIERDLAKEIVPDKMTSGLVVSARRAREPHEDAHLQQALFWLHPGHFTWGELEKQLANLNAGIHDRRHIRRTIKELGLTITILPGKSGRPRKPRTRKRTR